MLYRLRLVCSVGIALLTSVPLLAQTPPGGPPGGGPGARAQGPAQVGVITLERKDVPITVELPGRAAAYQMAAIRPKVGGEITEILYDAGSVVEPGTPLFRLEDETLAAELKAKEVAVTSSESALKGAQATVDRYRKLSGSGVSRADLEGAEVALAAAQANLGAAQAQRDLAQLAVKRTEITSPVGGVVALSNFSVGDIVSTGQSEALTEVMQIDPIYVDVSESRARILRNQQRFQAGQMTRAEGLAPVRLTLETGVVYDQEGSVRRPGSVVSSTTGTIPIRVEFPNPNRRILPGQFVRVSLTIGTVDAVLVPQRATSRAAGGTLTAFVAQDGKAKQVTLTEQGTYENAWIVTEGVAAGDQLVLDGLNNLRDGAEVKTVPVTIDAQGVVRDAAKPADEGKPAATPAGPTN